MYLFTLNRIYFTFPFDPLKYLIKTQQFLRKLMKFNQQWEIEYNFDNLFPGKKLKV